MKYMTKLSAALACAMMTEPAIAAWPDGRPIEYVIVFGPGGGNDLIYQSCFHSPKSALEEKRSS